MPLYHLSYRDVDMPTGLEPASAGLQPAASPFGHGMNMADQYGIEPHSADLESAAVPDGPARVGWHGWDRTSDDAVNSGGLYHLSYMPIVCSPSTGIEPVISVVRDAHAPACSPG